MTPAIGRVRIALALALVVLATPAIADFATRGGDAATAPGAGTIVYTGDILGNGHNRLTVLDRETGEVVFEANDYEQYHDVDPSPAGTETLLYAASAMNPATGACPEDAANVCTRNVIERVNYTTGETERLSARLLVYNGSSNTHDVDRIDASRYLVGDIHDDRIVILDVRTDEVTWAWHASAAYDASSGGYPSDWTHLNEVEVIGDGLYMVGLRNLDSVAFVDREAGLLANWTLGADGDHDTLYEQHNADYVPPSEGGPAVLVADSENNRVVEYARRNGSWERSWTWTDERLQWPRDADRLPNGNTLIVDTHGRRLLEVRPDGEIVWQRAVQRGVYDVELLGTGDESAGGPSMAAIRGRAGETDAIGGPVEALQKRFLALFPPLVLHGFLHVLPSWVSPLAGALVLLAGVLSVLWAAGEVARVGVRRRRRKR